MFTFRKRRQENTPSPPQPTPEVQAEAGPVSESEPKLEQAPQGGMLGRLRQGLSKSSSRLSNGLSGLLTRRRLDAQTLEELEDLLIMSDMGAEAAAEIVGALASARLDKEMSEEALKEQLAAEIAAQLTPVEKPLICDPATSPNVIMVMGVNGNGKTTTIGKLAWHFQQQGHRVQLAAADTFRAAATEQLGVWAERAGATLLRGETGADPASVAYDAALQAREAGRDVVLIDTAGRLQSKQNLMAQLEKMARVLGKAQPGAPHHVVMVLDGTTGQNALSQLQAFHACVPVTGLIVTKLDGTAKGGMVVALAKRYGIPIHAIGVGESLEDLQPFHGPSFARSLVGL